MGFAIKNEISIGETTMRETAMRNRKRSFMI
jgi:hypothetical protein